MRFHGALLSNRETNGTSLADDAPRALEQSQLALPGGPLFYLKATIVETTSPASGTKAAIEEHWIEVATHSAIPELLTDHDRRRRQDCRAERRGLFSLVVELSGDG